MPSATGKWFYSKSRVNGSIGGQAAKSFPGYFFTGPSNNFGSPKKGPRWKKG